MIGVAGVNMEPDPIFATLATMILRGDYDEYLDRLSEVTRERKVTIRDIKGRAKFFTLKPGDKVRFVPTVHPRYLAGLTGTLQELRQKKVTVDLDAPAGRFHRGIVTPVDLIEKVV